MWWRSVNIDIKYGIKYGNVSKLNIFLCQFINKILLKGLDFTKCMSEKQTRKTLIRLLLENQFDLGLHCLLRLFCSQLVLEIIEVLPYSSG